MDLDTSRSTVSTEKAKKEATVEEEASNLHEKIQATLSDSGGLATVEIVFPLKSIPTVIAGLHKPFLPIHGPETLSQYFCQFLSCSLELSQKAAACNHI